MNNQELIFDLHMTSFAEMYNVFLNSKEIHSSVWIYKGVLYCELVTLKQKAEIIYKHDFHNTKMKCFNSQKERNMYLEIIRNKILENI